MKKHADILAVTAFAAALRVAALFTGSLSVREGIVARGVEYSWADLFRIFRGGGGGYFNESFPYLLLLKAWTALGASDIWLRALSFLPGVAAVPVAFAIGLRLADRRAARLAALFTAVAAQQLVFSRAVDFMGLFFFVCLLAVKVWLDTVLDAPTPRRVICWGLLLGAALCLHPLALLLVIPMNALYFAWRARHQATLSWIVVNAGFACLILLWLTEWRRVAEMRPHHYIYRELLGGPVISHIPSDIISLMQFVEIYIRAFYALCFYRVAAPPGTLLVVPATLAIPFAFHAILLYALKPEAGREKARMIFAVFFAAVFAPACLMSATTTMDLSAALIPLYVFFHVMAGVAVVRARGWARAVLAAFVGVALLNFLIGFYRKDPGRPDWRAAAVYLDRNASPDTPIYFLQGRDDSAFLHYARRSGRWTTGLFPHFDTREVEGHPLQDDVVRGFRGVYDDSPPDILRAALQRRRRIWVVDTYLPQQETEHLRMNRNFLAGIRIVREKAFTKETKATLYSIGP